MGSTSHTPARNGVVSTAGRESLVSLREGNLACIRCVARLAVNLLVIVIVRSCGAEQHAVTSYGERTVGARSELPVASGISHNLIPLGYTTLPLSPSSMMWTGSMEWSGLVEWNGVGRWHRMEWAGDITTPRLRFSISSATTLPFSYRERGATSHSHVRPAS